MKKWALFVFMILAACKEEATAIPEPVRMTADSLGHFCMMQVLDHGGPKAQVHLDGLPDPIFFAQIRDAIAYRQSAERAALIAAFYVSDMAKADSWDEPGASNWMDAQDAFFVVGAGVVGGMGAPEIAPFSDRIAAERLVARQGGRIFELDDIPMEAVSGAVDLSFLNGDEP